MKPNQVLLTLASVIIMFPHLVKAQGDRVETGFSAYDVPADARSIAMGESFVALTGNQNAMMFNPAGLGAICGSQASYSLRRFDWWSFLENFKFQQINGTVETPYVNIGFLYNRYTSGQLIFSLIGDSSRTIEYFEYALAVALGRRFGSNWDVGFSLKTYDIGLHYLTPGGRELNTTKPILVDFGFIYSSTIGADTQGLAQSFSMAVAVQNLGGKLKNTYPSILGSPSAVETSLPQYVRVGFTYGAVIHGRIVESLTPLSVLLSGEYRTFLNGSDSQKHEKDYWGFGLELKGMEILSVRLSGFIDPIGSVYGRKGVPSLRYGLGVSIPFQKIGVPFPLIVQFDFAGIPPQAGNSFIQSFKTKTMNAYSISVAYENGIF